MLDIRFVRVNPEIVKADLVKRNAPEKIAWVDEILVKDARSRELKVQTDELRRRRNTIARDINVARKSGLATGALMAEAASLPQKIKDNDTEQEEISNLIRTRLMRLPNVLHESVPQGKDDTGNVEIRRVVHRVRSISRSGTMGSWPLTGLGRFRTGGQNLRRRILFPERPSRPSGPCTPALCT